MGRRHGQAKQQGHLQTFFKKLGGRYRRIRKRCKGKPLPEAYASKKADLQELEHLAAKGEIDLYYGDESQVSSEGYCPYGWQFPQEDACVYVEKAYKVNVFGLVGRGNQCHFATSEKNIDSRFVAEQLDRLSFRIRKDTFVVLDNARIHSAKRMRDNMAVWQQRGLYIFFLPPYSPQLNIAETVWRMLKTQWIRPQDYLTKDDLCYAVNRCMSNIGTKLNIKFSPFNAN